MAKITFIEHSGTAHQVDAGAGQTLMQAAVDNGVPGIDADCGGACACGTCHVLVSPEWTDKVGGPNAIEVNMINMTPENSELSRLACQIDLDESLDGLVVNLPQFQM